ncbi:MAG TPA: carboxypeptidase-like regulatory domain-containing protein, partial [Terriglobia bacterium]|nr:carboxypeptidase-like regulatory domain-containing protein [Terriglobia bacterium]
MKTLTPMLLSILLAIAALAQTRGGATISGTVRTPEGAPVAGARVAVMDASGTVAIGSTTETDESGRFRLERVPAGRWFLVAGSAETPVYHPGTDNSAATVVTAAGAAINGMDFTVAFDRLLSL